MKEIDKSGFPKIGTPLYNNVLVYANPKGSPAAQELFRLLTIDLRAAEQIKYILKEGVTFNDEVVDLVFNIEETTPNKKELTDLIFSDYCLPGEREKKNALIDTRAKAILDGLIYGDFDAYMPLEEDSIPYRLIYKYANPKGTPNQKALDFVASEELMYFNMGPTRMTQSWAVLGLDPEEKEMMNQLLEKWSSRQIAPEEQLLATVREKGLGEGYLHDLVEFHANPNGNQTEQELARLLEIDKAAEAVYRKLWREGNFEIGSPLHEEMLKYADPKSPSLYAQKLDRLLKEEQAAKEILKEIKQKGLPARGTPLYEKMEKCASPKGGPSERKLSQILEKYQDLQQLRESVMSLVKEDI